MNIWHKLSSYESLSEGWEKVARNKGSAGHDGISISAFHRDLSKNLKTLSADIRSGEYVHGDYRKVMIPKKKGGHRVLFIPNISDRIVHTSIANVLTPLLEPHFEKCSYAYRKGKSVQQALAAVEHWRDRGFTYVLDADIISYFDNVGHNGTIRILMKHISSVEGSDLLKEFISEMLAEQGVALDSPGKGLAQGSPLSPLLSNLYLDILDEKIAEFGAKIIRFADDFIILSKNEKRAEQALVRVDTILNSLGLKLHSHSRQIINFNDGFDFLGHIFFRRLVIKQREEGQISAALYKAIEDIRPQSIEETATDLIESLNGGIEAFQPLTNETHNSQSSEGGHTESLEHNAKIRFDTGERVLYVLGRGRRVTTNNHSFTVQTSGGHPILNVMPERVGRIEIGPDVEIESDVLDACLANNIPLHFVDGLGSERGYLDTPAYNRAGLQFVQAELMSDPICRLGLARSFVEARIRNQRTQLQRLNRRQKKSEIDIALLAMKRNLRKLENINTVEGVRGIEGACGALYWPALALLTKGAVLPFHRERPARNALNATINFLTSLLSRDIRIAIINAGLHPGFGALHSARDGNDACVYDLMEAFRAPLTEGLAVYLFNANRLKVEMFQKDENSVFINRNARSAIIDHYERALTKRVSVPGKKSKLAWRALMKRQALDLALACKRKDTVNFLPYLIDP